MTVMVKTERRYPIGAELIGENEAHFRVWAPKATELEIALEPDRKGEAPRFYPMESEGNGYFSGSAEASAGTRYRFRVDCGETLYPDPASRFQPEGPHGPSSIIDPTTFRWSDHEWRGCDLKGQIIYEFHVGTFTREGTWRAAAE